jgi:histidinol phosphatase-like PHP family hydrolase
MKSLDLVILGDMHYVGPKGQPRVNAALKFRFGLELGVRAVRDALRSGKPDAIVVLGDIVDRGSAPGALDDLRDVHKTLSAFGIPIIAVPGNHDDYPDQVQRLFGCERGIRELNGYLIVTFADRYAPETEVPSRPADHMAVLEQVKNSDKPVIAIQHAVLLPRIERDYPYNFPAAAEMACAYAEAGVCLSVSGHYHAGLDPHVADGVTYLVCPVLSEAPFLYTRLKMKGPRIESLERVPLSLAGTPGLHDMHVHTEFAYCATDITAEGALERIDLLGIPYAGIMEHADHLYLPRDGFWKRTDSNDTTSLRQALAAGHARYEAFRRKVLPLKSDRVFLGLEVEQAADGRGLAILNDDRKTCDYLIGAVHHFGDSEGVDLPQAELERMFMDATRQIVKAGVNILAHPFRYFPKQRARTEPRNLYRPVVDLLAARRVAAEVNFHTYTPEPEFFALCVKRGVKISLGTDSHSLVEVGELRLHLDLLRQIGALGRLDEILWKPVRRSP